MKKLLTPKKNCRSRCCVPCSPWVLPILLLFLGCNSAQDDDIGKDLLYWQVPQHPFLAGNGKSNLHNDAYMTDVYAINGLCKNDLRSKMLQLGRLFITIVFDKADRLITLGTGADLKRAIYLIDPVDMEIIDSYELPPGTDKGISGAGYFYLGPNDEIVVPTTHKHIYILEITEDSSRIEMKNDYDLSFYDNPFHIVSVLPDWSGNLWFVSEEGIVGVIDPSFSVQYVTLSHQINGSDIPEAIGNSVAVDETGGVFVVTDFALYRLEVDETYQPKIIWREEYDRGNRIKPGQFTRGSGTTPTIIGNDFVAITDNAEPRMNVLVYKRGRQIKGERLLCKIPVFSDNVSATENSLIAYHNSLVVENNYGYTKAVDFIGKLSEPGITRIDFSPDGSYEIIWESNVIIPSVVSKFSSANKIIYTYTKSVDGWYLTLLDWLSGNVLYQTKAGNDELIYNNHYSGIAIGPDGSVYIGCAGGIIRFFE